MPLGHTGVKKNSFQTAVLQLTFLAIIRPEGRWETLKTTPPLPAPSSQIFSKSSSFSSPTFCFCVRKASKRFRCCSSNSSSSSFFCSASKFVLVKSKERQKTMRNVNYYCIQFRDKTVRSPLIRYQWPGGPTIFIPHAFISHDWFEFQKSEFVSLPRNVWLKKVFPIHG